MGHYYLRGNIYWLQYRVGGKLFRESCESGKESVAKRKLRLREGDIEHGVPVNPRRDRTTFAEAVDDVIADFTANGKKSLKVVRRRITKHLMPFFGGKRLVQITRPLIMKYVAQRLADTTITRSAYTLTSKDGSERKVPASERAIERVSNGEINRELQILKRILNLARANDKCAEADVLQGRVPEGGLSRPHPARPPALGRSQHGPQRHP